MKELDDLREIISSITTWTYQRDLLVLNLDLIEDALNDRYLELPLDMYGEPIHPGDYMDIDGNKEFVNGVGFKSFSCRAAIHVAKAYRHADGDELENLLIDFAQTIKPGERSGYYALANIYARRAKGIIEGD